MVGAEVWLGSSAQNSLFQSILLHLKNLRYGPTYLPIYPGTHPITESLSQRPTKLVPFSRWLSNSIRGCVQRKDGREREVFDDAKLAEILVSEHYGRCPAT